MLDCGISTIIHHAIMKRRKSLAYAKLIGVNFSWGVHIYGDVNWSTEPWIITLGSNVHITGGTKFITHDGGTLLYRNQIPDLEITKPITVGNDVYIGTTSLFFQV